MALLRALLAAKQQVGGAGKLFVGHVDHSLRGDDSTADADWLAEQCRRLAVPLFIEKAHVSAIAEVRGDGLEEAARATRYEILARMAETLGVRFVALGHHRDDQIETILFRLLRGSGLRGLAGMPATRPLAPSVAAVRPLLQASRREIESYLQAVGQSSRHDETNLDAELAARNAIRQELLPQITERFGASTRRPRSSARSAASACGAWSWHCRRSSRKSAASSLTAVLSATGLALGFALAPFATALPLFAAVQVLIGFSSAATFAPLVADISHWFDKRRGIAVAIAASGNYLAGAIWPTIIQTADPRPWLAGHLLGRRRALLRGDDSAGADLAPQAAAAATTGAAAGHGRRRRLTRRARSACRRTACKRCWWSPASAAASPCRCRRSISSPTAPTWGTAWRAARRCCR